MVGRRRTGAWAERRLVAAYKVSDWKGMVWAARLLMENIRLQRSLKRNA